MSISKKTINTLNVMQNSLIRYMLQLNKSSHMGNINKILKIMNIKHLYYKLKMNFVKQLESHQLCNNIYKHLKMDVPTRNKTSSYIRDVKEISNDLNINIEDFGKRTQLKQQLELLESLFYNNNNEKFDSIKKCLENFKFTDNKNSLKLLTRSYPNDS